MGEIRCFKCGGEVTYRDPVSVFDEGHHFHYHCYVKWLMNRLKKEG